ncbi:MAG: DMT family transporter [Mycobacterium leprae]
MATSPELMTQQRSRFSVVDLSMVAIALIWGINAPVVKGSMVGWDPLAYNALRFAAAAIVLFVFVVSTDRNWRLRGKDLWAVIVLGAVGNGVYQYLFIAGMARAAAANISLIIDMAPLAVTLWSGLTGLDRINRWIAGGAVLSVAGVVMVALGGDGGLHLSGSALVGDTMALGAMICWAAYTVYAQPLMERVGSSLRVTAWTMLVGAAFNLAIGVPALLRQDYHVVTWLSAGGMAFSALFSLVVSYVVYAWAVTRIGAVRTAIYLSLVPILAALFAWVMIGERWVLMQWAGSILVVFGVTVAKLESHQS